MAIVLSLITRLRGDAEAAWPLLEKTPAAQGIHRSGPADQPSARTKLLVVGMGLLHRR